MAVVMWMWLMRSSSVMVPLGVWGLGSLLLKRCSAAAAVAVA